MSNLLVTVGSNKKAREPTRIEFKCKKKIKM